MRWMVSLVMAAVLLGVNTLQAEDVLRFRGENSQGKYNETKLLKSWPEAGLEPLWIASDLGAGWSSVIKVGNRLYLNGVDPNDSNRESLVCLDLNGKILGRTAVGVRWNGSFPESRATPTYVPGTKPGQGHLLLFSGGGELFCVNESDGKVAWQQPLSQTYETRFGNWGIAESVVVKDDVVYAIPCGNKALAVALKLSNGSVIWEAESNGDNCAYVTPILYEDQLVIMTATKVNGVDIKTGEVLWEDNYRETSEVQRMGGINCNVPLLRGNQFFVTAGYDQGGVMYKILPNHQGIEVVWTSKVLDPHHGGAVEVDGKIYGSNWVNNDNGKWCCLDWETGETIYEEAWERLGKGVTIYADGMLYLYEEKRGTLGLGNVGDTFDVVGKTSVKFGNQQHWAHPVISDGILYVRRGEELAAYDIRAK